MLTINGTAILGTIISNVELSPMRLPEQYIAPPSSALLLVKFEPVIVPLLKYTAPPFLALLFSNEESIKSSSYAYIAPPLACTLLFSKVQLSITPSF